MDRRKLYNTFSTKKSQKTFSRKLVIIPDLFFLASPIVGGLSDYYGRRPLMLVCTAGIAASYLTWTMASTFSLFILARFIGGLSKGNVSLSTSAVADISDSKSR